VISVQVWVCPSYPVCVVWGVFLVASGLGSDPRDGAVTCLVVASKQSEACEVVHLHVDLAECMWLHTLQKSKIVDYPTELLATSILTMCFGRSIAAREQAAGFGANGATHLQWYSSSQQVPVATPDG
jgi:hypothetical protein